MATADLSSIEYFLPIAVFLIVVAIIYAVLLKIKLLGEHKIGILFVAFLVAIIFISAAGAIKFVGSVAPAFVVLIISLAFLLILLGLIGKPTEFLHKGIGIGVLIIFALIFLFTAFTIYSNLIIGYLPGRMFGYNANPEALPFFEWLYSPRVAGAILLVIASAFASWILVKAK